MKCFLEHDSFNKKMVEGARLLLEGLGEVTGDCSKSTIDLKDANFLKTPYRIAKSYVEMCQGLGKLHEVEDIFSTSFPSDYNGIILVDRIAANSMCPHHFLPVSYKVDFAYIPEKRMLGLSKIPRFIKLLAMRPVLQEDFTKEVIQLFLEHVKPQGAIAVVTGIHNCMKCRGIEVHDSAAITSEVAGVFEESAPRQEFFELLKLRNR